MAPDEEVPSSLEPSGIDVSWELEWEKVLENCTVCPLPTPNRPFHPSRGDGNVGNKFSVVAEAADFAESAPEPAAAELHTAVLVGSY